jgi:hypothetical protein
MHHAIANASDIGKNCLFKPYCIIGSENLSLPRKSFILYQLNVFFVCNHVTFHPNNGQSKNLWIISPIRMVVARKTER